MALRLFERQLPVRISAVQGPDSRLAPERGDIVVFEGPEGQDVVKRVIGLPGDTIAVEGGRVVLNGQHGRRASG